MALTVTHQKTNDITDWTQADLDAQIALGNFPPGTLLADIVLPSDWNDTHTVSGTLGFSSIDAGTNTGALVIGNGGSLSATGTGGITATIAPAGTLTGTTLAANVVTSSLTSVGTIATGVWNAGAVTSSGTITGTTFVPTGGTAPTNGMYLIGANNLGWAINGTGEIQLTDSAFAPFANDGNALGTTARMWSDLFLASGGVINFNNGNVTLTHAAGSLTSNVPLTANSFIPTSSTAPTNGMYLVAANTLGWSVNSAAEMRLTSTALSPNANDGNALGTTALMWSDLFLASGAVINFNNGDVTVTHSSDTLAFAGGTNYTFDNEVNTAITSTFAGTTASIDAAALLGQDIVTWTPASTPTAAFVTSRMRKTIANATSASITGVSHPIGGYDWLVVNTGANTLDLAFVHEAKYTKSGAGTNTAVSFYKPALDTVAGTVSTITLFDGDMDLSGITYTNAYLMNCNRSYLKFRTAGLIETSNGDQQVLPRERPAVVTNNYYPIEGVNGLFAGTAHTRNLAWAVPWVCPERTTWTRAGFTNGTGVASAVGRMGIYKDSAGRPGARIADFGTVNAGVADTGAREITISQLLDPGIYWLVLAIQGGASDNSITYAGVNSWSIMGMPSNTAQDGCCYVAAAGALPDPFGSATATGGGFAPFMWMRKV